MIQHAQKGCDKSHHYADQYETVLVVIDRLLALTSRGQPVDAILQREARLYLDLARGSAQFIDRFAVFFYLSGAVRAMAQVTVDTAPVEVRYTITQIFIELLLQI